MSLSVLLLACRIAAAQDDVLELKTENLPYVVRLPRGADGSVAWTHALTPEPEVAISLERMAPSPFLVLFADIPESYQPDFARMDAAQVRSLLGQAIDLENKSIDLGDPLAAAPPPVADPAAPPAPAEPQMELGVPQPQKHPALGDILAVPLTMGVQGLSLHGQITFFPVEAGFGLVTSFGLDSAALEQGTAEALGAISLTRPPLPPDKLATGHYVAEAGYEVDLPPNWRALTARELSASAPPVRLAEGPYAGKRAIEVFLDPASVEPEPDSFQAGLSFGCVANTTEGRPLEVLDPTKSRLHETNYLTRARVMLKEGTARITSGGVEEVIKFEMINLDPVQLDPADPGTLTLVPMGDREAYLWRVQGTQRDKPVLIATFYTAWDNVGLDCLAVAPAGGEALIDAFEQTMKTLTVTDAPNHAMTLSFLSRYKRWWPYAHPAAQLYWLMIPLFLIALVPAIREWWETRR